MNDRPRFVSDPTQPTSAIPGIPGPPGFAPGQSPPPETPISMLPPGGPPTGDEVGPFVQNGQTVKLSIKTVSGFGALPMPLPLSMGGTGATGLPTSGILIGTPTQIAALPPGDNSQVLMGGAPPQWSSFGLLGEFLQGQGQGNNPVWAPFPGITGVTAGLGLTGGGTSGTVSLALSVPVTVANGGTGATTASGALTSLGAYPAANPSGYIPDSVQDGTTYGRNNGTWVNVGGGIQDAISDGTTYARKNAAWTHITHNDITDWAANVPIASSTLPVMDGTAAVGTGATFARADHAHPTDTSRYAASNPAGYQTAAQVTAAIPVASSTTPLMDAATAVVGTGVTWARADHVHPTDTSRYAASNPANYQTATQVSASLGNYMPLSGGVFTGNVTFQTAGIFASPSNLQVGGGSAGQVLSTNGSSGLSWITPAAGGGTSTTISATPPASPAVGSLWWDSVGGQLYIWYNDGTSSQWVITNNIGGSYLPLAGGTLTGALSGTTATFSGAVTAPTPSTASGPGSTTIATTAYARTGVVDGGNAAAGQIGEYISASPAAISLSTGVTASQGLMTLTAGDWDIGGTVVAGAGGGTTFTFFQAGFSTTTAFGGNGTQTMLQSGGAATFAYSIFTIPTQRVNVAANQPIYMVVNIVFSGGTMTASANIWARRMR